MLGALCVAAYFFYPRDENPKVVLPLANEVEYTERVNQHLKEKHERRLERQEKAKTPEGIAASEKYWNKMRAITQGQLKEIKFYGKVIDQHGKPVEHVDVIFKARSGYMAEGDGRQFTRGNEYGVFVIEDVVGAGLGIGLVKAGYQFNLGHVKDFENFPRFEDSKLWSDHSSPDNPFVFKAWKIADGYPLTSHARATYGFKLNEIYSLDFFSSNKKRVKKQGQFGELDLQVYFTRDDDADTWEVTLTVPDGGLIETNDVYMNLAPENGYQSNMTFSGTKKTNFTMDKLFYIHSRGNSYGRLLVKIRPYRKIGGGLTINHVMNLEQGRRLEYKKN